MTYTAQYFPIGAPVQMQGGGEVLLVVDIAFRQARACVSWRNANGSVIEAWLATRDLSLVSVAAYRRA